MKRIIENKQLIIEILLFFTMFFFTLITSYIIYPIWGDQVWSYGFSYNISKGLIIYKDFNAVPTPLCFILSSVFINIFGNHIISTNIFESLLVATIGMILYKTNKWQGLIPLLIFQFVITSPYNVLATTFLFIILYLIHTKNDHEFLIAYLVGLTFITKQNIGIYLFIPLFFYSKHKIKTTFIFTIPFIVLCIFFLLNNSLFQFLDYTIFGLVTFNNNRHIFPSLLVIQIISSFYLIYHLIKSKFQDKEAFYILMFQLISYPLCELGHFIPAFVAFLYYFIKHNNSIIIKTPIYIILLLYFSTAYYIHVTPININFQKDLFYLKNKATIKDYLEDIYNNFDRNLTNVYFVSEYSYLLKIYYDYPINEFDVNNDGNWGYFSNKKIQNKLIKECKKNNCKFVITKQIHPYYQIQTINKLLKENFEIIGEYDNNYIYGNKKD